MNEIERQAKNGGEKGVHEGGGGDNGDEEEVKMVDEMVDDAKERMATATTLTGMGMARGIAMVQR